MDSPEELTSAIATAVDQFPWVEFALLFGSGAVGRLRPDSDLDVAIYVDSGGGLEIEAIRQHADEAALQVALERVTERNVDLLILNRAPATVCASAFLTGRTVVVRNRALYTRYFLAVTDVAIDFLQTEREYRAVAARSHSLSELDKSRLLRILEFIETELQDVPQFREVSLAVYRSERDTRRNFDRWVETLISAVLDAAKIILSSEHRPVPQTYAQILSDVETIQGFSSLAGALSALAALRNIMAHEYLDLRFPKVKRFAETDTENVRRFAVLCNEWLLHGDTAGNESQRTTKG